MEFYSDYRSRVFSRLAVHRVADQAGRRSLNVTITDRPSPIVRNRQSRGYRVVQCRSREIARLMKKSR